MTVSSRNTANAIPAIKDLLRFEIISCMSPGNEIYRMTAYRFASSTSIADSCCSSA